jgi:hypothetical protein
MGLFGGMSEEELRSSGTATTARVVYVDDTGKRRAGGTEARLKIQLKIDSGAARGRELDKTKWVPVTKMPHVGEMVQIRFDPDNVDDWAWGDSAMYEPARVSAQPGGPPLPPPPPGTGPVPPPGTAPVPSGAPSGSDEPMVEFIQNAAGPWGQMPGFKKMIESAMSANMQMMQSMDLSEFTGQGYPVQMPAAGAGAPPSAGADPAQDTAERLKRLDKLLEQGLVTAEEHRELRQKIIDAI